jgi:hypothetical protein
MSDETEIKTGETVTVDIAPADYEPGTGPNAIGMIPRQRRVSTEGNIVRHWEWPPAPTPTQRTQHEHDT